MQSTNASCTEVSTYLAVLDHLWIIVLQQKLANGLNIDVERLFGY